MPVQTGVALMCPAVASIHEWWEDWLAGSHDLAGHPPAGRIDNRAADNQCGTHDPKCHQQRYANAIRIFSFRQMSTPRGVDCGFYLRECVGFPT